MNITEEKDGFIRFEVDVTEPDEVLWWSLQWGPGAEIIEPEWLRRKAEKTIYEMSKLYENEEGVPKV